MGNPGRAVYDLWTSPRHVTQPDHLPALIVTPSGRPQDVLYTFLHTNWNQENYLTTPSKTGELCVAKLCPSSAITGAQHPSSGSSSGHGAGYRNDGKVIRCEADRALRWSITNTGIAMPTYKLTLPNVDPESCDEDQPLFQVSKPNKNAPWWTLWYYTYAGHLIPPKRVEFGRIEKTSPNGRGGSGCTRITINGKSEEEKAVWKTLGDGNEDMVEWIVVCAALNVLDDEIRDAAKACGQPLKPPPAPGTRPIPPMSIPPMNRPGDYAPPPVQSLRAPGSQQQMPPQQQPQRQMSNGPPPGGSSLGSGSRRPVAPPLAQQQHAQYQQQQQTRNVQYRPGPQTQQPQPIERGMQSLRIDPRAPQPGGPRGPASPSSYQQNYPSSAQMYRPQPAASRGPDPRERTISGPGGRPGALSPPEPRPQQLPLGRGPRPVSPINTSNMPPGGGQPSSSSRSRSPLSPPSSASPPANNSSFGPLGPPRPGMWQAQSSAAPNGPRKMPSSGALGARSRSPINQPVVDPHILPSKAQQPTRVMSPTSPPGPSRSAIPNSLKPSKAPVNYYDDSELAYAS